MGDRLNNLRDLAAFRGRGRSTVAEWTKREDWPFARSGPWDYADAPAMLEWSGGPRGGGPRSDGPRDDGFWIERDAWPPLAVRGDDGHPLAADRLPPEVVGEWERACVAAGVGHLTPAGVVALVADAVAMQARLVDVARWLAPWLAGHGRDEIERRLRTVMVDHLTLTVATAQWIGTNHQPAGRATGDGRDRRKPKSNRRPRRQESGS